ncbi:MAG: hypothetical protein HY292_02705 [Planctomycetes bacterium]|nr:hypothetical protein [Planctomycetota bacterium]
MANIEKHADAVGMILGHGDLLEQAVFADSEISNRLYAYAQVWMEFVLPHRLPDNPGRVQPEWMLLAQHNYTAMVRCQGVKLAYDRIIDSCARVLEDSEPGLQLLALHEASSSFFANAGACVDNLEQCFAVEPLRLSGLNIIRSKYPDLDCIYDRRTQFVHKIVVPCFLKTHSNGTKELAVDVDCLQSKQSTWDAATPNGQVTSVDKYYRGVFEQFLVAVGDGWQILYSKLKDDQARRGVSRTPSPPVLPIQGSPSWPATSGSP